MISGPGPFIVGGTSAAARNVISGNANAGVAIANGSANNVVEGNLIGTNAAGTAALGNGSGIAFPQDSAFAGASEHNTPAHNLISGNVGDGIAEQALSVGNVIAGNIGLTVWLRVSSADLSRVRATSIKTTARSSYLRHDGMQITPRKR